MKMQVPEPERWADRTSGGAAAEDRLGLALRRTRAATVPSSAVYAHVDAGVAELTPARVGIPRWRVAAVALVGVLALGGSVGAARGPLRAWAERHGFVAAAPPSDGSTREGQRPVVRRKVSSADHAPLQAPRALEEALTASVAVAPSPARRVSAPVGAAPAAEAPEAPAAEEARLLKGVFQALRAGTIRGEAALAALDDYDRHFPSGLLRLEARLARVEALLALRARGQALALLDAWEAEAALPRGARVARGELRADAGRCAEATLDFTAALAVSAEDALGGRALYGSAACAVGAGDDPTAVAALTRYLEGHPEGPHAAAARDALARLAARSPRNVGAGTDMREP